MILVVCQLITIGMMAYMTVSVWLRVGYIEKEFTSFDETFWSVHMQRMGSTPRNFSYFWRKYRGMREELELPLGVFFAGNRWRDTIYLGTGGERVRLFLNVQKNEIVLTVLEGSVQTRTGIYEANQSRQIALQDFSKLMIGDVELQFFRKKVM